MPCAVIKGGVFSCRSAGLPSVSRGPVFLLACGMALLARVGGRRNPFSGVRVPKHMWRHVTFVDADHRPLLVLPFLRGRQRIFGSKDVTG